MRSRYAAFARGLGDYLVETLASDHPDRAVPDLARQLSRAREKQRFLGLTILFTEGDEVLFHARIFEKGVDRSFAELSTFVKEGGAWRYASGILKSDLPDDPRTLTRDDFLTSTT